MVHDDDDDDNDGGDDDDDDDDCVDYDNCDDGDDLILLALFLSNFFPYRLLEKTIIWIHSH